LLNCWRQTLRESLQGRLRSTRHGPNVCDWKAANVCWAHVVAKALASALFRVMVLMISRSGACRLGHEATNPLKPHSINKLRAECAEHMMKTKNT
jgi:uncharacterized membrane protein YfbV (UPF0208 family)